MYKNDWQAPIAKTIPNYAYRAQLNLRLGENIHTRLQEVSRSTNESNNLSSTDLSGSVAGLLRSLAGRRGGGGGTRSGTRSGSSTRDGRSRGSGWLCDTRGAVPVVAVGLACAGCCHVIIVVVVVIVVVGVS